MSISIATGYNSLQSFQILRSEGSGGKNDGLFTAVAIMGQAVDLETAIFKLSGCGGEGSQAIAPNSMAHALADEVYY